MQRRRRIRLVWSVEAVAEGSRYAAGSRQRGQRPRSGRACGGRLERISPHRERCRERRKHVERGVRVRDKAARLLAVCVSRIRVPRPWNTFTGFTANRHVYTMLIIRPTQPLVPLTLLDGVSRITILHAVLSTKYVSTFGPRMRAWRSSIGR